MSGYVVMPVRSPLSRWPLTAQLRSKSLGVFSLYSLCKQWTVYPFRALSLVVLLPVAMARPTCHRWCGSSYLVAFVHVLHLWCFLQQLHFTLFTCAHVLRHMLSAAVRATISRFACIRYSVLLLQPTPTLPLIESRALPPPPFATSTPLQHLSSHRARRVVLASGHESNSEGDTPSRIQHSTSGLISTWPPPLQRATASLKKTIRELRTAFN